jgi:hypothetical protein
MSLVGTNCAQSRNAILIIGGLGYGASSADIFRKGTVSSAKVANAVHLVIVDRL